MSIFSPRCEGSLTLDNVPEDFAERMAKRVEEGLLMPGSRKRANYSVRSRDLETIRFGADDRMTAFNIGLNEVTVRRADARTLHYDIEYRRWARYALYLSLAIVAPMALVPFIPAVHNAFSEYSAAPYMYWGMLLFWGVVWPWLLAVLHHRFAARCLERILGEVCGVVGVHDGIRYESEARLFGMPLVCIAMGPDSATGQDSGIARGFIAIGNVAVGFIAIGGVATGFIAIGGLAVGFLAIGGGALGFIAIGGGAAGGLALGGAAVGVCAIGGSVVGIITIGGGILSL